LSVFKTVTALTQTRALVGLLGEEQKPRGLSVTSIHICVFLHPLVEPLVVQQIQIVLLLVLPLVQAHKVSVYLACLISTVMLPHQHVTPDDKSVWNARTMYIVLKVKTV